jgi:hypothetical protein
MHKSKDQGIINNKNNKSNYDIYNINNFYSNTVKIKEKSLSINVQVPKYEELDDSFFEDNNIEVRIIVNKIIFYINCRMMKIYLTKLIQNFMIFLKKKK